MTATQATIGEYESFVVGKRPPVMPSGFAPESPLNPMLFEFQRHIVTWALARGKAAIWADCGLGKTLMAIEWAAHVVAHSAGRVLILTPLAVAAQFVAQGEAMGIRVTQCRESSDIRDGINVTNYDRLDRFADSEWAGVVLDESSILKDFTSKTRGAIIAAFGYTPYRLACTATPSPNDFTELGNHAEFLGIMTRAEMLSMYFVHDGGSTQDWRLKGHAQDDFWTWLCSWAVAMRVPSDLGYSDDGYILPEMTIVHHVVDTDMGALSRERGLLFVDTRMGLSDQRTARKLSMADRVSLAAGLVNEDVDESWIVWCDLNDESDALAAAIDDAVEVRGADKPESKEQAIADFTAGRARVMVTKPSICGWGVNWQHCARVVFVGVTHSFEKWYQALRRTYRFGQTRHVECHVVTSSAESGIVDSLERKQRDAVRMVAEVSARFQAARNGAKAERHQLPYEPGHTMTVPAWVGVDQ